MKSTPFLRLVADCGDISSAVLHSIGSPATQTKLVRVQVSKVGATLHCTTCVQCDIAGHRSCSVLN